MVVATQTKLLMIYREEIMNGGEFVKCFNGEVRIIPREEYRKCETKNCNILTNENKISNPLLDEIILPFHQWMDELNFYSRGLEYGTLEFVFFDEETFPIHIGR